MWRPTRWQFADIGGIGYVGLRAPSDVAAPRPRAGFDVELVFGTAVVCVPATLELHRLSATATAIWLACEETSEPARVASLIAPAASAASADVAREAQVCTSQLSELGLLP